MPTQHELYFRSLYGNSGRGFAFPCDSKGQVDLNDLPDTARTNYLYATHMVGREFEYPAIRPVR